MDWKCWVKVLGLKKKKKRHAKGGGPAESSVSKGSLWACLLCSTSKPCTITMVQMGEEPNFAALSPQANYL